MKGIYHTRDNNIHNEATKALMDESVIKELMYTLKSVL
jgi:hypothetical protein